MEWVWGILAVLVLLGVSSGKRRKSKRTLETAAKVGTAAAAGAVGFKAGWKIGKKLL